MPALYFTIGFLMSAVVITLLITVFYYYLTKKRKRSVKIQGYLDLIPDLNQTQRLQVQEIRRVFLPKVSDIRRALYIKRSELADLLFAEPLDRKKLENKAKEILHHQSELGKEVVEHIIEEKDLLTPRQKRKFYNIIVEQFSSGGLGVHDVKGRKT